MDAAFAAGSGTQRAGKWDMDLVAEVSQRLLALMVPLCSIDVDKCAWLIATRARPLVLAAHKSLADTQFQAPFRMALAEMDPSPVTGPLLRECLLDLAKMAGDGGVEATDSAALRFVMRHGQACSRADMEAWVEVCQAFLLIRTEAHVWEAMGQPESALARLLEASSPQDPDQAPLYLSHAVALCRRIGSEELWVQLVQSLLNSPSSPLSASPRPSRAWSATNASTNPRFCSLRIVAGSTFREPWTRGIPFHVRSAARFCTCTRTACWRQLSQQVPTSSVRGRVGTWSIRSACALVPRPPNNVQSARTTVRHSCMWPRSWASDRPAANADHPGCQQAKGRKGKGKARAGIAVGIDQGGSPFASVTHHLQHRQVAAPVAMVCRPFALPSAGLPEPVDGAAAGGTGGGETVMDRVQEEERFGVPEFYRPRPPEWHAMLKAMLHQVEDEDDDY
ncbi:hypothetical protein BCR44DRAFT_1442013 [Catenaria anguillulae PL171]|uniref:Uncharacterized protein n=1 Tax=Catenaria anguillulae PL171 TaxID=765915 RepID=A0A1Y2HCB3_9FUNG|nr:hypothetical protein BCR44DRAFT_1442013 [Catenaria anguillulae PL171]